MKKRLPAGAFIPALVLMTWVTAVVSPTAYAIYRCQAMAATMASPCCEKTSAPQDPPTPQLRQASCCTRETVSLERVASELTARHADESLQRLQLATTALVGLAPASPPPAGLIARRASERIDAQAGSPLLRQTCSLLI